MRQEDLKPLFLWAKERGDANIYDRILIKLIPELLKEDIQLTTQIIENSQNIYVPITIYHLAIAKVEELIGIKYDLYTKDLNV